MNVEVDLVERDNHASQLHWRRLTPVRDGEDTGAPERHPGECLASEHGAVIGDHLQARADESCHGKQDEAQLATELGSERVRAHGRQEGEAQQDVIDAGG